MAKNVFISFRFSDGNRYKDYLSSLFESIGTVLFDSLLIWLKAKEG